MSVPQATIATEPGSAAVESVSRQVRPSIREACLVAFPAAPGERLVRSGRAYAVLAADGVGPRRYAHVAVLG